jgi:succinylglutamic semialdehyde dehydrogenase
MLLQAEDSMIHLGGNSLKRLSRPESRGYFLKPGLIDVTNMSPRADTEFFGPLLQVICVKSFDDAIEEANNTKYGLSAGLISDRPEFFEKFRTQVRAGIINWNRQTTGALSKLPFGGIGLSGNHRPSGYFAADYCSYPVASIEVPRPEYTNITGILC